LHGGQANRTREDVVETMNAYLESQLQQGVAAKHVSRHMLGLFHGLPGARAWRRYLSENAHLDDGNAGLLRQALMAMREAAPVARPTEAMPQ